MRLKIYIFLIISIIVSCNTIKKKELIGSWKRINLDCQNCKGYSQKITFTNDSMFFDEYENNKLVGRNSTKYEFDEVYKTINYDAGNVKVQLRVLKLKDLEMELLNTNQKKTMKFKLSK